MCIRARFFVMTFIKGPVCRGQMALDVIESRFWVFFVNPDTDFGAQNAEIMARQANNLRLPAAYGSDAPIFSAWPALSGLEMKLLAAKSEILNRRFSGEHKIDLSLIWDGDGRNPNAALTIFRHFNLSLIHI